jgi:hypothetical protein
VRTMQRTKQQLRISAFLAIAASVYVAQSAGGQGERLTVEVGECVDLPTPEQRLAGSAAPAATSAAAPVAATIAVPASSSAPEEFGFRQRRPEPEEEEPPPPEIRARVAELRETVPNAFLITLDNGQVWRQTRPDSYLSLKVGQEVRIYFSRWRAYRLDSPQMRGYLQVERVR